MEGIKVVYQRKPASPRISIRKRTGRTASPNVIKDQSSKYFRIQVNTPTFYRPMLNKSVVCTPYKLTEQIAHKKRKRVSYLPNSTLYQKLNAQLTLNNLEFERDGERSNRSCARSQLRRTIDFTKQGKIVKDNTPLEARGSSINSVSNS
jgi:hypothetical protein